MEDPMANRFEAELEALKREKAQHDEEWTRIRATFERAGRVEVQIPAHLIASLESAVHRSEEGTFAALVSGALRG
jgi:hypothetical protein